jgi:hypothetical protein
VCVGGGGEGVLRCGDGSLLAGSSVRVRLAWCWTGRHARGGALQATARVSCVLPRRRHQPRRAAQEKNYVTYKNVRLGSTRLEWEWVGEVHEFVRRADGGGLPSPRPLVEGYWLKHDASGGPGGKRFVRDEEVLTQVRGACRACPRPPRAPALCCARNRPLTHKHTHTHTHTHTHRQPRARLQAVAERPQDARARFYLGCAWLERCMLPCVGMVAAPACGRL